MRIKGSLVAAVVCFTISAPAFAQDVPLSQLLVDQLVQGVTMRTVGSPAGSPHDAHFIAALGQAQAPFAINKALVQQLGTFPIGSGSSGFAVVYDPKTKAPRFASASFGPGFAERALTNSPGQLGFGFNTQTVRFGSFDGVNLGNGNMVFVLQHNDCCPAGGTPSVDTPYFEGDLVTLSVGLKVKTTIVAPFVNYGINGRWDVGAIVPLVHVSLDTDVTSTVDRVASAAVPSIHTFAGADTNTTVSSGSATGIGDVLLRTKYRFRDMANGGLAAGLELRLPTGDKDDLLGTGATQFRLSFIASGEKGVLSPHVNVGFTFSNGDLSTNLTTIFVPPGTPASGNTQTQINGTDGVPISAINLDLPNEFNYVFGTDVIANNSLTISFDVIGRTLMDTEHFAIQNQTFSYFPGVLGQDPQGAPVITTSAAQLQATRQTFTSEGTGAVNLVLGVVGAKFRIPNTTALITGSVLFPLTYSGLRPNVTPVIGLDYSFVRRR